MIFKKLHYKTRILIGPCEVVLHGGYILLNFDGFILYKARPQADRARFMIWSSHSHIYFYLSFTVLIYNLLEAEEGVGYEGRSSRSILSNPHGFDRFTL